MKITGVYEIRNLVTNRVYIGSSTHIKKRFKEHRNHLNRGTHQNQHLQNSYNKHGPENFQYSILEECSNNELIELEDKYIGSVKLKFNIRLQADSPAGMKFSEEHKRKLSLSKMGDKNPMKRPEVRAKVAAKMRGRPAYNKGKKASKEAREKMSKAKKGKKQDPDAVKRAIETKRKNGSFIFSESHKKKIALAKQGAKNPNAKAIKRTCPNTKEVVKYECLADAIREGFNHTSLGWALQKKQKLYKGFIWDYITSKNQ